MARIPRSDWSAEHIKSLIAEFKSSLASHQEISSLAQAMCQRAKELADPMNPVRGYVACLVTLAQHERAGGLKDSDVAALSKQALELLKLGDASGPKLQHLYGDVFSILAQIHRKQGRHWDAAFYTEIALLEAGVQPAESLPLRRIAAANRALRIGNAQSAMAVLSDLNPEELSATQFRRFALCLAHSKRMSGSHDEARKTVQHLAKDHRVDEDTLRELEWEDLCLDVKLDAHAGVNKMLAAIKTGQSHFHFAYALDTIQWSLASGDLDLIHAAPKVKNLYRRFAIDTDRYRVEYTAVKSLSDLYVDGPSLRQSLEALAALMGMSSQFISLEREMLLLRSARMWLTRNKMRRLADHCELRYRSFSYGLSGGVSEDVLFELVP